MSGKEAITVKEALRTISKKLNKWVFFFSVPLKLGVIAAYILKLLTVGKIDIVEKVLRMGEDRAFSHELAKQDFLFSPISFEEGIEKEVNEFKQMKLKKIN